MRKKRHTAEQIIARLREAEVALSQGEKVPAVCRKLGITEQTYYRWRKEYGGLKVDQAKRLKELEKENARGSIGEIGSSGVGFPICGEAGSRVCSSSSGRPSGFPIHRPIVGRSAEAASGRNDLIDRHR